MFCVTFHTMKHGFELSIAGCVTGVADAGGRGSLVFSYLGNTTGVLPSGSGEKDHCREMCAVVAMIEYRQAATTIQWVRAEDSCFLFSGVLESREKRRYGADTSGDYLEPPDLLASSRYGGQTGHFALLPKREGS